LHRKRLLDRKHRNGKFQNKLTLKTRKVSKMSITLQQAKILLPDTTKLYSDEPEMESSLHYTQLMMLVATLEWWWRDREDFFIGANLTIYFNHQRLKTQDSRGPDFFLVKETEKRPRTSWVVWEEKGRYPNLIIELLSDSTARVDRVLKKQLYQNRLHTPEYFWFSPDTLEFKGFRLEQKEYVPIKPLENGWLWSQELGLYLAIVERKLRYITQDGLLVPTLEESVLQEQRKVEVERQKAESERQRANEAETRNRFLEQRLKELGMDPNSL